MHCPSKTTYSERTSHYATKHALLTHLAMSAYRRGGGSAYKARPRRRPNDMYSAVPGESRESVVADMSPMGRAITNKLLEGQSVYLGGEGGTGKSYTTAEIVNALLRIERDGGERKRVKFSVVASTGIAKLNLSHAINNEYIEVKTLHQWSNIGLGVDPYSRSYKKDVEKLLKEIKSKWTKYPDNQIAIADCEILIIDECSMVAGPLFDLVCDVIQEAKMEPGIKNCITVLFVGDFLQLPPVNKVPEGEKRKPTQWLFSQSTSWTELEPEVYLLETPQRYPDLDHFYFLRRIRRGRWTKKDIQLLSDIADSYDPDEEFGPDVVKPTKLYSWRQDVDRENQQQLDALDGAPVSFIAEDFFGGVAEKNLGDISQGKAISVKKYKEQFDEMIPKKVQYKVGAQVMLTANLQHDPELVNGRRGIVKSIQPNYIEVLFERDVEPKPIEQKKWEIKDNWGGAYRMQYPLVLAWAITMHKSQGLSLDSAEMLLDDTVFEEHQAYVALSRVRTRAGLRIKAFYRSCLRVNDEAVQWNRQYEDDDIPGLEGTTYVHDKALVSQSKKSSRVVADDSEDENDDGGGAADGMTAEERAWWGMGTGGGDGDED